MSADKTLKCPNGCNNGVNNTIAGPKCWDCDAPMVKGAQ